MDRCSHLPGAALKSIPLLKPLLFEFLGSVPRVPSATQLEVGTRSSVVLGSREPYPSWGTAAAPEHPSPPEVISSTSAQSRDGVG